ncbi:MULTISPECIES: DUF742 domain-containing protein [Streptomyces]|uniref:DUF742 domain-containing protein n=1 Tax=Streptomyces rubiginosohelvolus TaxID=67362 RepID=A0ABQ3CBJ5_9ACTN|nr:MULTISPECIES: DUF742 domain-containing protein [Streptomyces]MCA1274541.1 DUF742 domain-containing protein [Streptomyces sp. 7G]RUP70070.1 hypothetical protein SSPNP10_00820 [Streptomyces sp. NP10]WST56096.1 DUF742 domain-containing protein [Streptomyces rubiginosohelvolus]GGS25942.1 hypothetical protein GCM10010284_68340 [Streptomyces rubiginosohelvolus]GGZ83854.1 hypothetical protein GCM10010328_67540 [Streptomyces pluricolorescens]
MATPTGGHSYNGDQRVPGEHGDNRFGFPAAPGGQGPGQYQPYQQQEHQQQGAPGGPGPEWPQQQPGPGWPQQPQQRYDSPQQPRIQPVQQRRAPEPAKPAAHNPLVRPYAMTGGRTRPRYQLAIEALVSTTADPARLQGQLPEHQRICRLCIEIKSVAEISALLSIPLGVARILVADLAEAGLVAIHQPGGDEAAGGQPDVTLLERVLSGLRKL